MADPAPAPPAARLPANMRGIALMVTSSAMFGGMAGIVRHLSGDIHPFEAAFFRNFFGLIMFLPILAKVGLAPLRTRRFGFLTLRAALNATSMTLFFLAVSLVPIAKVAALNFTSPLFVTLAAIGLLGERMGLRRTIGLAIGFTGALVILRPGLEVINPGSGYALLSAAIWAAAIIVIKVLSRTESSLTITVYAVLFLTPLTLIPALFVWRWPDLEQLAWLAGIGFLGTGGHLLFAQALSHADASLVMPFDFTKLLWAALIGFFFFTEVPVVWTWVGGAVIFTSATYVAYRERISDRAAEPV